MLFRPRWRPFFSRLRELSNCSREVIIYFPGFRGIYREGLFLRWDDWSPSFERFLFSSNFHRIALIFNVNSMYSKIQWRTYEIYLHLLVDSIYQNKYYCKLRIIIISNWIILQSYFISTIAIIFRSLFFINILYISRFELLMGIGSIVSKKPLI